MTIGELFQICIGVAVVYKAASLLINLIVKEDEISE
jgi:hypothetical protein